MSVETNEEVVQEQDDSQFEAGFAEARGDEPPTESEPEQVEEVGEEVSEEAEPVQEEQPQAVLAGLTEEQVKDLLLKAGRFDELNGQVRKVFGRLGEFNQALQTLQQPRQVSLDKEKLKRLSEKFPELAEDLASDLSEALAGVTSQQAQPAFDPAMLDRFVSERLAIQEDAINKKLEVKWLTRQHKDWKELASSQEFELWKQNVLPEQERVFLDDTWDAEFISEKLSEFKNWRDQANQTKEKKQKRLEAAVAPRGGSSPGQTTQSEDEAFTSGFKAVRQSRLY